MIGVDANGPFEIRRRYKEFNLLRTVLFQRYPGLYVPPIPSKKTMNKNQQFIEERCFYLNMFIKQVVRCPYIFLSDEFKVFVRPPLQDVDKGLTYLPKMNN